MEIDLDSVPSTVDSAVQMILESLTEEDKEYIKAEKAISIHHSFGQYIRNSWSLWENRTPLKEDAVNKYKLAHADDISSLITTWIWHIVLETEFNPLEYAEKCNNHWKMYDTTSLEAGGWFN